MARNYTPGVVGQPYVRTPRIAITHDVNGHTFVSVDEMEAIPLLDGTIFEKGNLGALPIAVEPAGMLEEFPLVDVTTNTSIPGMSGTVQQLFVLLTSFVRAKQLARDAAQQAPDPTT